jgi:DNA-directed RNA polymerase III subunit RPC1
MQSGMKWNYSRADVDKANMFKSFVDEKPPSHQSGGNSGQSQHMPQAVLANAKVSQIQFGMLKSSDVTKLSHMQVSQRMLYEPSTREPIANGVLDRRMGTSDKKKNCLTCDKQLVDCVGHFGHVELDLPVFHIGYIKEIVKVLQTICKTCSRVLLSNEARNYFISKYSDGSMDKRSKSISAKDEILDVAKKCKRCPHCGSSNGQVKKLPGLFKIVHELKNKDAQVSKDNWLSTFKNAILYNSQLEEYIPKALMDLSPYTVLKLFNNILDEDCVLLNVNPSIGRPEDMIITYIPVPPVCIRPSVAMGTSGSNEDDLTVKLGDILYCNSVIRNSFEKGAATAVIVENWDYLQQQVAMLVNSDLPGFNKGLNTAKPIRSLTSRLKGKQGRFRGNLSGKRVDFSARTVISPDPNLRVDQVGIPERVAKVMTFPERVNKYNIDMLRKMVNNGPDIHPGANVVEFASGNRVFLKYGDREQVSACLRYGDLVERHMIDNDLCLFNRQPSLHKMSIMAHRAKILDWRTFRFNECVCTPYNADFDGDEMNIHLPQTLEAKAEALQLMAIHENLVTPRNGEPLITATQDFLTSAFLITLKDVFMDRTEFCRRVALMNDANEYVEIPEPAILKPVRLWTGKQLINLILRPSKDPMWPILNIEYEAKNYTNSLKAESLCPVDGYVVIRNSQLMCGNLCKGGLGGGKKGMFYALVRDWSPQHAARFMNRLAKFSARFIGDRGFSIGIDDVTPSRKLFNLKKNLIEDGYARCGEHIQEYKDGTLENTPGCDPLQSLESICLGRLNKIREETGALCFDELDRLHNSPLIMAVCGSKGSKINIAQMVACVGQQAVSGHRIPEGFVCRTLPHFPKFAREPAAKGFVQNSFYSGLTATEFFFHTMGGREGLVDTAVKTAETGYMQRRLVKALEDLCVNYDKSVRTSERNVVQFEYGDDGLDPVMMTDNNSPVNFMTLWQHCRAVPSALGSPDELFRLVLKSKQSNFGAFHQKSNVLMDLRKQAVENKMKSIYAERMQTLRSKYSKPLKQRLDSENAHVMANIDTIPLDDFVAQLSADARDQFVQEQEELDRDVRQETEEELEALTAQVNKRKAFSKTCKSSNKNANLKESVTNDAAQIQTKIQTQAHCLLPSQMIDVAVDFMTKDNCRMIQIFSDRFRSRFVEFLAQQAFDMLCFLGALTKKRLEIVRPMNSSEKNLGKQQSKTTSRSGFGMDDDVDDYNNDDLNLNEAEIKANELNTQEKIYFFLKRYKNSDWDAKNSSAFKKELRSLFDDFDRKYGSPAFESGREIDVGNVSGHDESKKKELLLSSSSLPSSSVATASSNAVSKSESQTKVEQSKSTIGASVIASSSVSSSESSNASSQRSRSNYAFCKPDSFVADQGMHIFGLTIWHFFQSTRGITQESLILFMSKMHTKYVQSVIEPGTAVGAIGAQSIGEPGTQMTLKTFHFAGVASMNITLGVPRIKEIINASKKINTPIITAPLETNNDIISARIVKGRIEKTVLGEVAKRIEVVLRSTKCYIVVELDMETINNLQLTIDSETVFHALLEAKKLKLKDRIRVVNATTLRIYKRKTDPKKQSSADLMQYSDTNFQLHSLKNEISNVIVQGISTVNRSIINDTGNKKYNLLVEGYDLRRVMNTIGVKGTETSSNHIMEVEKVLGIEAARATIMREIHTTMDSHGLSIDPRHVALLADIMSYRGEILGITRFGIAKMKESVMMLASFEKTADHLFEAAIRGTCDDVSGVSDSIIMGNAMPIGTGLFSMLQSSSEMTYGVGKGIGEFASNQVSSASLMRRKHCEFDQGMIGVGGEKTDPRAHHKTLLEVAAIKKKSAKASRVAR